MADNMVRLTRWLPTFVARGEGKSTVRVSDDFSEIEKSLIERGIKYQIKSAHRREGWRRAVFVPSSYAELWDVAGGRR